MEVLTLADMLTSVGSILTGLLGWMTEIATWIVGTDLAFLFVGMAVLITAFAAIKSFYRG